MTVMKAFRYIISSLIFAIAAVCGYNCIGQISLIPYIFFGITLGCGLIVLLDGGKKKNA